VKQNLVTQQLAAQLDPLVFNDSPPKWHVDAHDVGVELAVSGFTDLFHVS
jgi:mediator of RNA polymerase II transcription subunit 5